MRYHLANFTLNIFFIFLLLSGTTYAFEIFGLCLWDCDVKDEIIVVLVAQDIQEQEVPLLPTEDEKIEIKKPQKVVEYDAFGKKECEGNRCKLTTHASIQYVQEDNIWKNITDARSLKDVYDIIYLEDKNFPLEVIDYNYTHITICVDGNDNYLNTDIPIRIYDKSDLTTAEKTSNINIKSKSEKLCGSYPFDVTKMLKFGYNSTSTTILVNQSSNDGAENNVGTVDATAASFTTDEITEYIAAKFYVDIPAGATIKEALVDFRISSSSLDEPLHYFYLENNSNPKSITSNTRNISSRKPTGAGKLFGSTELNCGAGNWWTACNSVNLSVYPNMTVQLQYLVDTYGDNLQSIFIFGNGSVDAARDLNAYFIDQGAAYAPKINITYDVVVIANTSCQYGGSGMWNINCAENCTVNTVYDIGKNPINISGEGRIFITSAITNCSNITIKGLSATDICEVTVKNANIC